MGWFSKIVPKEVRKPIVNTVKAATHPGKAISHLVSNPADAIVPNNVQNSGIYKSVVRPIVKAGTGAGLGFLASGGNPAGAVLGALSTLPSGGLTSKPFRPLPNVVAPIAAGGFMRLASAGLPSFGSSSGAGNALTIGHGLGAAPTDAEVIHNAVAAALGGSSGTTAASGLGGVLSSLAQGIQQYGPEFFNMMGSLANMQGNKKLAQAAAQARDAAIKGNATAYQNALQALANEFAQLRGRAVYEMGHSGFVPTVARGMVLGNVLARLQHNEAMRRRRLGTERANADLAARSRASADIARARTGMITSGLGAARAGLGLASRIFG